VKRLKRASQKLKRGIIRVANSITTILAIYVVSLFVGGTAYALIEGTSFGDGLWWAVVTALTVGYGDLSPVTTVGRIVATIFQHFWVYGMIPLIAVNLLTDVIQNKNEFTHEEQERNEALLEENKARLERVEQLLEGIANANGIELPPALNTQQTNP